MALEVIWQPEGRGDVLSANDLVTAYPTSNTSETQEPFKAHLQVF